MDNFEKNKDILLAEDDDDDVLIFEVALNELALSYKLRRAKNGDVLFVLLKESIPHILFLDINMPCKDGVACIMEIRKNREYDKLPVIMYTSNLSNKFIDDCYRNGANFYLSKTNTFRSLVDKLQKVFSIEWGDYMHYPPKDQFFLS